MKNINFIQGGVCAPEGFRAGGIHCGIRKNKTKPDLALIFSETVCSAAAVYTQNLVYGAPITVTRDNISDGTARAIVCNSGIANTCNADGVEKAEEMCEITAQALGISPRDVIVASTGVIGKPLDTVPVRTGMPGLVAALSADGSDDAAQAIMTTDTVKKEFAVSFEIGGKTCKIGAISKGSGMICPNMATMLGFVTTDTAIDAKALDSALREAVSDSFNMLCVDGDTSTNDMVCVLANGKAGNSPVAADSAEYALFVSALTLLCKAVVRVMAKDGEGATKLVECRVSGASDEQTAKTIAKSVIRSPLVKAAMFGADANWGRVLCAMGYAGVKFDPSLTDVCFSSKAGKVAVCEKGFGLDFSEEKAKEILLCDEVSIDIDMNSGDAQTTAFGCDLTYDYVKINGDYRT